MSFAPTSRRQKSPCDKAPPKAQNISHVTEDKEEEILRSRIALLEDIAFKLQAQQELFEPLLGLLARSADVMSLEEQAKSYLDQAHALEQRISAQHLETKEFEKKFKEVGAPTSISEGHTPTARSLPRMLESVTDIEATVQTISMKRKVNAKRQEVGSKELFIQKITYLQGEMHENQNYSKKHLDEFAKNVTKRLKKVNKSSEQLKKREENDLLMIKEALDKHAMWGGGSGESSLQQELNLSVEQGLTELTRHLDEKHRDLELSFRDNLLALRNTYQSVLSDHFTVFAIKRQNQESVNHKVEALNDLKKKLNSVGKSEFAAIKQTADELNEALVMLNDKARRFVRTLTASEPAEKKDLYVSGKIDFERNINEIWHNVDLLRENLRATCTSINADLFKMGQCLQEVLAQSTEKHEEIAPEFNALKKHMTCKLRDLTQEIEQLRHRLFGIWRALNTEAALEICFTEKQAGDAELFETASLTSLN